MARARRLPPIVPAVLIFACILALPLAAAPVAVGGRVAGPRGEPVAGARVALVRPAGPLETGRHRLDGRLDGSAGPEPAARAETDRQGRFTLQAPEPGMWRLTVDAKGYLPLQRDLAPLLDETEIPAATLSADAGLEVRVADEAGRPLAARLLAAVSSSGGGLVAANGAGWERGERLAVAGADGLARLPRGTGERLELTVAAAGRPPVQMEVAGASARVVLAPGAARAVRVLDERGRPAAGVLVLDRDQRLPLGRTGADGRWTAAVPARGDLVLRFLGAQGGRGALRLAAAAPGGAGATGAARAARAGGTAGVAPGQAQEATVRLSPRRTVSGRVVDRETRRPLPGALVWEGGDPSQFARTDKAGGYTLQAGDAARVFLQAGASGYVRGSGFVVRGAEGPTLALLPAGVLEGVVADGAGRPLAGAEVALTLETTGFRTLLQLGMPLDAVGLVTRSSAAGRFRLAGVPAGIGCTLTAASEGLLRARQEVPELRPFETRSGLRLVLASGRRGAGLVVDRAKRPVAGAHVTLTEAAARDDVRRHFERLRQREEDLAAWTDAAGRFALAALAPGRYDLAVEAEGFAPVEVPGIEVPGEGDGEVALGTVTLSPGAAVEGRVVDDRKQPVAGAEVSVEAVQRIGGMRLFTPFSEGPPRAVSDADGRFTVRDLRPGGSVSLVVGKPGYTRETVPGVTAPTAAPVEVLLRRSGRVAGRVLDADKKPVEGASVQVRVEHSARRFTPPSFGSTEADGRFEIADVEPGSLVVEADAVGLQSVRLAGLELPAGGELAGLELVMEPGAAVEGRVLGTNGLPVVGAQVQAGDPSGGGFPTAQGFDFSDGDGRYRLDGMAPGHATVTAEHASHGRATGEVDVRPGVNSLDLTFEPGFEVSGRVIDAAGEPVAGAELVLRTQRMAFEAPRATSAADGSFSFSAVATGTYTISGHKGTARLRSEAPVEVRGAPVAGVVLRLDLGRAVLSGSLSGVSPAELGGVSVQAFGPGGLRTGQVDFRGTYRVEGLTPGDWKVRAQVGDGARRARGEVAIPEGATEATLDLDFTGGLTLRGVATRGGEPVRGAEVFLNPLGGGDGARTETDASGAFRMEGLAPGRYRLELMDLRSGLSHSQEVELTEDRQVSIALETVRVAGHVRDAADGKPLADVTVQLEAGEDGQTGEPSFRGQQSSVTDSRGYFRFDAVTDRRVRVMATRAGYARAERVLDLGQEGVEDLDLQLQATEGIRFQVVSASGLPPGAVLVAVVDAAGRPVAGGHFETGAEGEVRVSTVPAGSWELLVRELDGAALSLPITAPGALGRLQLPAGGELELTVPALEGAAAPATITLLANGRPYREPEWGGGVRASWPLSGGRISLSGVPAGHLTLTVTAADGRTWTGTVDMTPGGKAEVSLR